MRCYSELVRLQTDLERFNYLKLSGAIGEPTFGSERYVNQTFYHSFEWKQVRRAVIARDNGCDLGIEGLDIFSNLHIHHMNPMTVEQIHNGDSVILDPEFLITVNQRTHNAIHYGDESQLPRILVERRPGDTNLW